MASAIHPDQADQASLTTATAAARYRGTRKTARSVSYTHLTLPTNREV